MPLESYCPGTEGLEKSLENKNLVSIEILLGTQGVNKCKLTEPVSAGTKQFRPTGGLSVHIKTLQLPPKI